MDKRKQAAAAKKRLKESAEQALIEKIIETAANFVTVTDTLRSLGVHIFDYENLCKKHPTLRQSVNDSLRRKISVQTRSIDENFKEVVFILPKHGLTKTHHIYSKQEKEYITDIVCDAIMQGITVKSICESIGVNFHTFYSWANADGKNSFGYTVRRFKDTHEQLSFTAKMEEVTAAKVSLRRALSHDRLKTTTEYYETRGVDGSKLILKGKTESIREVVPNATLIQFVLTNHDENYKKTVGGIDNNVELMDTEDLLKLIQQEKEVDERFKVDGV